MSYIKQMEGTNGQSELHIRCFLVTTKKRKIENIKTQIKMLTHTEL